MNDHRDRQPRRISRRILLRGASTLAVAPVLAACTGLDALDVDRHTVEITDQSRYDPAGITIPVGGTVIWRNEDEDRHTVTTDGDALDDPTRVLVPEGAEPFDSGELSPGEQFEFTFDVPGTYVYGCRHHQAEGMVGTVTVDPEN